MHFQRKFGTEQMGPKYIRYLHVNLVFIQFSGPQTNKKNREIVLICIYMCFMESLPLLTCGVSYTELTNFRENVNAKGTCTMIIYASNADQSNLLRVLFVSCFKMIVLGTGAPKARLRLPAV